MASFRRDDPPYGRNAESGLCTSIETTRVRSMSGALDLLAVDDVDVFLERGMLHFKARQLELAPCADAGHDEAVEVQGFSSPSGDP